MNSSTESRTRSAPSVGNAHCWFRAGAVIILTVMIAGGGWYARRSYLNLRAQVQCGVILGRVVHPLVSQDDTFITVAEFQAKAAESGNCLCPKCGSRYIYKPVKRPGVGRLADLEERDGVRIIAWCPEHCHIGRTRFVLSEHGATYLVSESAFQRAIVNEFVLCSEDIYRSESEHR